jgi:hypothetical protein
VVRCVQKGFEAMELTKGGGVHLHSLIHTNKDPRKNEMRGIKPFEQF